jgi:gas vesicle protein
MPNTFLNKVSVERETLSIVNKKYTKINQLAGLSVAAIEQWHSQFAPQENSSITFKLLEISKIAQTLSNRSNETFEKLDGEIKASLAKLMAELSSLVCAAR